MELVYIWVKEYKMFKSRGFVLNNNFYFQFTPKEEKNGILSGSLITQKKSKKSFNIFGDRITNLTALIGQNGSGKTSTLEMIINRINNNDQMFIVLYSENNYIILGNLIEIEEFEVIKLSKIYEYVNIVYYTNIYSDKTYNKGIQNVSLNARLSGQFKTYDRRGDISNAILFMEKYKGKSEIYSIFKIPKELHFILKDYDKYLKHFNENFDLRNIEIDAVRFFAWRISQYIIESTIDGNLNSQHRKFYDYNGIDPKEKARFDLERFAYLGQNGGLLDGLLKFIDKIESYKISNNKNRNDYYYHNLSDESLNYIKKNYPIIINNLLFHPLLMEKFNYPECKIILELDNEKMKSIQEVITLIKELQFPGSNKDPLNYFCDLKWNDLSSGEKAILNQFSSLDLALSKSKFNLILIDEGEVGFHPEWQRRYINILISFLRACEIHDTQIILTSHSPFLLSDIPNENIVFLTEKGYQENIKIQTFAQNIHTILYDSFFLKGGTIGEFAKEFIINLVKEIDIMKEEDRDIIWGKIQIIGEPIIKKKLEQMYLEKNVDRKSQIQLLKDKLRKLEAEEQQEHDSDK